MKIAKETQDKLKRYLVNADPFLWNVLESKNKKGRLQELKSLGLLKSYAEGGNPIYNRINQDLLVDPGVEGIIERIVVPRVKTLFTSEILEYFRRCWEQGQTPTLDYLNQHKLYRKHRFTNAETYDTGLKVPPVVGYKEPAFVFFQIDTRYDLVERWTTFAGLWFEEIEPLLGTKQ
jgi:hypothetical protein